jgi:hypothetical protein
MSTVAPVSAVPALTGVGQVLASDPTQALTIQAQVMQAEAAASALETVQPAQPAQPSALEAAVAVAATRQDGLAELMADLGVALAAPGLSPDVKAAIGQVFGFQLPTQPPPSAADLRAAVAASGLFLEARLAGEGGAPMDLKAALGMLSQALAAAGPEPSAPAPAHAPPPPPFRDGPQAGQPAVASNLTPVMPAQAMAAQLLRKVGGVLSRQLLQQAASTPRPGATSWLFELPLATQQGAAIAQFQIDADEPPAAAAELERTWRARFTLDLAAVGPVHVNLALRGSDLRADLWAETAEAAARLDQDRASLALALQAEALDPQIAIRPGAPQTARAPAGRFVDSAA